MRIVPELDAGPILYRVESRFPPDITAGELSERLSEMGAAALVEALAQMESGTLPEVDQDDARATYAPKLDRDTARLDWTLGAVELDRWIRGCDPWPGAWTTRNGEPVQLFAPSLVAAPDDPVGTAGGSSAAPGTVVSADPRTGLRVATGDGVLSIGEVKPAGRGRMPGSAWVAGRGVETGDMFV
jgi:methionyl-tRNA formyltransferase